MSTCLKRVLDSRTLLSPYPGSWHLRVLHRWFAPPANLPWAYGTTTVRSRDRKRRDAASTPKPRPHSVRPEIPDSDARSD